MARPIVTPAAMGRADADAIASQQPGTSEAELIARAGYAVALAARGLLGRVSGRRVAVIVGGGNNGADGRVAATVLERWGARCDVVPAGRCFSTSEDGRLALGDVIAHRVDLVVDAAFGTGFKCTGGRGPVWAPDVGDTPVLAVDIPSGIDGQSGDEPGRALDATATVTFAAVKPGLLFGAGARRAGRVSVADIGLAPWLPEDAAQLLDDGDVALEWPRRSREAHKWSHAVLLVGGEPGMGGATTLGALAALRAGAGHVTVASPDAAVAQPVEAVHRHLDGDWVAQLSPVLDRVGSVLVGPGLSDASGTDVRSLLRATGSPVVVDAGALSALVDGPDLFGPAGAGRAVLTPHDGEYRQLMGSAPGSDRMRAARAAAERFGATVVLKGPSTVVADPEGHVLVATAGDQRLATAGSGDVLAGIIAAGVAGGLSPFRAAGLGAQLHGAAARDGSARGLIAGDLPDLIAARLDRLERGDADAW